MGAGSHPARPFVARAESVPFVTSPASFAVTSARRSSPGFHAGSITPYQALTSRARAGSV